MNQHARKAWRKGKDRRKERGGKVRKGEKEKGKEGKRKEREGGRKDERRGKERRERERKEKKEKRGKRESVNRREQEREISCLTEEGVRMAPNGKHKSWQDCNRKLIVKKNTTERNWRDWFICINKQKRGSKWFVTAEKKGGKQHKTKERKTAKTAWKECFSGK